MDKYNMSEYPYGQFPTKFTKRGQEKYFEELTQGEKVTTLNISPEPQQNQQNNNTQGQPTNNFDISKLLPLIKMMGDKKSISSSDMLQMFLPLLGGGNMSGISEIMGMLNKDKPTEEIVEDIVADSIKIDDYKRID